MKDDGGDQAWVVIGLAFAVIGFAWGNLVSVLGLGFLLVYFYMSCEAYDENNKYRRHASTGWKGFKRRHFVFLALFAALVSDLTVLWLS